MKCSIYKCFLELNFIFSAFYVAIVKMLNVLRLVTCLDDNHVIPLDY
jgi:hypothetical protein